MADLFSDPLLSHVALSPDGSRIAARAFIEGHEFVVSSPVSPLKARPLLRLDREGIDLGMLGWASETRIVGSGSLRFFAAVGVRARSSRLFAVDADGGALRVLGKNWPWRAFMQFEDRVIDFLWDDPDAILVNYNDPRKRGTSAKRIDVHNGRLLGSRAFEPDVDAWFADHAGRVRAGVGQRDTRYVFYARSDEDSGFDRVDRFDVMEGSGIRFAGFSEDPAVVYVYVSPEGSDRLAVRAYDLRTKSLGATVFSHEKVDAGELHYGAGDRLLAVSYVVDEPALHFVDEAAARRQAALDRALPGTINRITQWNRDYGKALVVAFRDTVPPRHYLYTVEAKSLTPLFEEYPKLRGRRLAEMQPIAYPARDGRTIHGYLTLPLGAEAKGLATLVMPHGGPDSRDVKAFDPTVQLFASHGYAVLQMNFRGSAGYGTQHQRAGNEEWGRAIQDDVTDGVRFLVDQGIADPKRIGIFGGSFGGYTALMGLVKTPELYRAGASVAGVSDLDRLLADDQWYMNFGAIMGKKIGGRWKDRDRIEETSPVEQVEKIQAPVLLGHGEDDWRVHVAQAENMAKALRKAGKPVELHVYDREGHGFYDERNRIDFYTKLVEFFLRHVPPGPPQSPPVTN